MVKICQTGLLKLNFETNFFCQFPNPWALGCQGWVVIPQNVKKSKNHCTLLCIGMKGLPGVQIQN
jgi:hypothetical protein